MSHVNPDAALDGLKAQTIQRLIEVDAGRRRQILVDEGVNPTIVAQFSDLLLDQQEVFLIQALRKSTDTKETSVRQADPITDAMLFRRPAYTSKFSGQDIAERSG